MKIKHIGLVCRSEIQADRFYRDILGLHKEAPRTLPVDLCRSIFNVDTEMTMINYIGDHGHFEVFIAGEEYCHSRPIDHVCIEVEDIDAFLAHCESFGISIHRIPRGTKTLYFITDNDDNLFEIKGS